MVTLAYRPIGSALHCVCIFIQSIWIVQWHKTLLSDEFWNVIRNLKDSGFIYHFCLALPSTLSRLLSICLQRFNERKGPRDKSERGCCRYSNTLPPTPPATSFTIHLSTAICRLSLFASPSDSICHAAQTCLCLSLSIASPRHRRQKAPFELSTLAARNKPGQQVLAWEKKIKKSGNLYVMRPCLHDKKTPTLSQRRAGRRICSRRLMMYSQLSCCALMVCEGDATSCTVQFSTFFLL